MRYFVLHGHFYQPPRDNPWWDDTPREESAQPFHDWNERIYYECYLPNATARILDKEGKIIEILNNYSYINFNFGPTLLLWLKEHHPDFIEFLKIADRESQGRNNGHGNAIAQAYNHIIMPLANYRDKKTQIIWGIEFFKNIFEREPEALWLPETAIDNETLELLIEYKLKYIILSPYQVEKIRPLEGGDWHDVSGGTIDTQHPYRIFNKERNAWIDVFFYHGPLSHAISFQHLMHSSLVCADHIVACYGSDENALISIACDGETFGHHHPFSEMCLAHLLKYELPGRNITVTNFGNYLEKFPPRYEAILKKGKDGLGTSWSCVHGVARWKEDCGCRIALNPNWHQKWRAPLREALNWLQKELDLIFERYGKHLFKDPWEARNDYIHLLINPNNLEQFIKQNILPHKKEKFREGLKLLEMQHMIMLSFTSCGWFFDEISGLEAVQNLKYAARAIQLAKEVSGEELEEPFLRKLSLAPSNIEKFANGKAIYEIFVNPLKTEHDDVMATYLILTKFLSTGKKFYRYEIELKEDNTLRKGEKEISFGIIKLKDNISREEIEKFYLLRRDGLEDLRCYLRESKTDIILQLKKKLEGEFWLSEKEELARLIHSYFPADYYEIKDIYSEEREKILSFLFDNRLNEIFNSLNFIWEKNLSLLKDYTSLGLALPIEMRMLGQAVFNYKLKEAILNFKERKDFNSLQLCGMYLKEAKVMKVELDFGELRKICEDVAEALIEDIKKNHAKENIDCLIKFHRYLLQLGIDYHTYLVQNIIYQLLLQASEVTNELRELAELFTFNVDEILKREKNE